MSDLTPVLYIDQEEEYLKAGVSVEEVFELSDEMLLLNTNNPDGLFEIFSLFHQYGLPDDEIQLWFALNADFDVIEEIVNDEKRWKQIGLEPNDYVDKYLAWRSMRYKNTSHR